MPRRSTYPCQTSITPWTPPAPARCTSDTRPKATAWSTGVPRFVVTCAEMSTMWTTAIARNRYPLPRRSASTWCRGPGGATSVDRDLPEHVEVRQHLASPEHDGGQWIFGHRERQAGFFPKTLVEVLEQRSAAGEDDPAVHDVGGQLGRRA